MLSKYRLSFFVISVYLMNPLVRNQVETTDLLFDEDLLQINGPIYSHNVEAVETLHNYARNFHKMGKKLGMPCNPEHQAKMYERREYYVAQLNAFKLPYNRTQIRRLLNDSFVDIRKYPQFCRFHPFWQKESDGLCDIFTGRCCFLLNPVLPANTSKDINNNSNNTNQGESTSSFACTSALVTTPKPAPTPSSAAVKARSTFSNIVTKATLNTNNSRRAVSNNMTNASTMTPKIIFDESLSLTFVITSTTKPPDHAASHADSVTNVTKNSAEAFIMGQVWNTNTEFLPAVKTNNNNTTTTTNNNNNTNSLPLSREILAQPNVFNATTPIPLESSRTWTLTPTMTTTIDLHLETTTISTNSCSATHYTESSSSSLRIFTIHGHLMVVSPLLLCSLPFLFPC